MYIQYQNANKFTTLLNDLEAYLTIPIKEFYDHYFNINTADPQGLANWGKILNQTETIAVPDFLNVFGFDTGDTPMPLDTGYPQNFGFGNFYNGQTAPTTLTTEQYRAVLKLIYLKYTSNCSVGSCVNVINSYIQQQYSNPLYKCVIIESQMQFAYSFNFTLQDWEIALFKYNDTLPRPGGIDYKVYWVA